MKGEAKDSVELELALKVCRKDLTKAQEELNRMKAEYWDVVPQRNWDTLERTHKQTLLQVANTYTHNTLMHTIESLGAEFKKNNIIFTIVLYCPLCGPVEDAAG